MQKVVDFLEKNVQWLVLGIGGVVFLLMAWMYLVQPPVTVEISGQKLRPGEIDQQTVQGPVAGFKQALATAGATEVAFKPPTYEQQFRENANPAKIDQVLLARLIPKAKPVEKIEFDPNGQSLAAGKPSKMVDVVPGPIAAATFSAGNNGRSVVLLPDPKKMKNRRPNDPPLQQVDMIKADKDWVTEAFEIDVTKLGDAYKKVFGDIENLPPNIYETMILYVELVREEKGSDGKWGNRTTIKPLAIHEVPPFDLKDQQKSFEFNQWALEHPELVTTPPFYQTMETGGDMWVEPGTEVAAVVAPAAAPAATPTPRPRVPYGGYGGYGGRYGGMPGYGGYGGMPGYGGAPGGRGRRPSRAMADGQRPYMPPGYGGYGGMPGYGGYGGYGRGYPGMGYPGMGYPGMGYPGMRPGQQAGPAMTAASPGMFNVTTVNQPIRVWAHDDTVEAGHTYRYAIYYYIKNPLFQSVGLTEKEDLKTLLALRSELSNWSDPVKITPKVAFFLASVGKDKAKFEVFTWQAGTWKKKTIERAPGDLIPDTTWTVVDQRREGNDSYILLVNQGGQIMRRDAGTDRKSPLYLDLSGQAETAKGATAAAR